MDEKFSAFLDSEASRDEADSVINALLRDDTLRASWSRQHWLRTTLRAHRGEDAVALDMAFSARVMRAIAADEAGDTAAAPARAVSARAMPARVVPKRSARGLARRWRSMAGVAAVASAAGIVFLVHNPLGSDARPEKNLASTAPNVAQANAPPGNHSTTVASSTTAGTDSSPASGAVATVANPVQSQVQTKAVAMNDKRQSGADHWSVSDPAIADELNSYLDEHNGMARGYGLSGTTPALVRVATYGQDTTQ